jgi:hypothetical protein
LHDGLGSTARRSVDTSIAAWNHPLLVRESGGATKVKPFERYIGERLAAFPELTATRLLREVHALGYQRRPMAAAASRTE